MLKFKKAFLKYNHLCTLLSFNHSSLNSSIWKIRNYLRYIFFFLFKKICFLRLYILYKFTIHFRKLIKLNNFSTFNFSYLEILNSKLFIKYCTIIKKYYLKHYTFFLLNKSINVFYLNNSYNLYTLIPYSTTFYIKRLNAYKYFYSLYKSFSFIIFIWLYILKYLVFYKLKVISIPIKEKVYNVLRSPYKYGSSREKFKLKK